MDNRLVTFGNLLLAASGAPINGESDPMSVASFFKGVYGRNGVFRQGFVVMYNPNTHSASVQVRGETSPWACVFSDELISYSYGYSETCPPREGELVLVMRTSPFAEAGIIVGRIPYPIDYSNKGDLHKDPENGHRSLFTQLPDTKDTEIPCFNEPLDNKNDSSTHIATHFRPTDVYPGEFARVNQHNCGIKGGMFSSTLLGGGASLRLSALKNSARLSCDEYVRHTLHGSFSEFHNGRYLSSERNLALYQEERLGGDAPNAKVWTDDAKAPFGGENQTMRPRMKDLTGFFGHLSSKFCFRPDPNEGTEPRVQGKGTPFEAGVSRETIDPSGQYRLSAAGMIAIERTGRIPVPVRNCYPSDVEHDISNDPESLKPFEHDKDPACRQLELFDRQAYDLKNQYARAEGLGQGHADYDVPQEEQLEPLKDEYDEKFTKSSTVKLKEYDKRRAGVYIGEDGSVILRDAWGSEIVMLGGNIQLSCAGNVMLLPGKTQLTIAGDDIVQKAQNSVDIHASEHDVRLSAARNMEILGGGDEKSHSGGVIIESRGEDRPSPDIWDGVGVGESARVRGITLRTKNQHIVLDSKWLNLRSRKDTRIISGGKKLDGNISVVAENIRSRAKNTILSSEDASLSIMNREVRECASVINMISGKDLQMTKGKSVGALIWADGEEDNFPKTNEIIQENVKDLKEEHTASAGFDSRTLEKMIFGFRTSYECRTNESWTLGSQGEFRMYEPAWVQVMSIYETLKEWNVKAKNYEESPAWKNGKPFPGEESEYSARYVQLSGMKPQNLTSEGFNKSRYAVKDKSEISTVLMKYGYKIRG